MPAESDLISGLCWSEPWQERADDGRSDRNSKHKEDDMDGSREMTMDATKPIATLTKTTENIVTYSHSNIEAIMKSGQVWAAGWQNISNTMAAATQAHFDQTLSNWKALISVKSLKEAMDLQASLTQTSFQAAFAETGTLTDASMKLVEQTMAPITERLTLAMEKLKHPAN
jgi:phasin family protein